MILTKLKKVGKCLFSKKVYFPRSVPGRDVNERERFEKFFDDPNVQSLNRRYYFEKGMELWMRIVELKKILREHWLEKCDDGTYRCRYCKQKTAWEYEDNFSCTHLSCPMNEEKNGL